MFRAVALALLFSYTALAQAAGPDAGRSLAATCSNCHGTDGRSVGGMPALAGMPRAGLVRAMRDFRDGKRPATIMNQLAKGYDDAQIDALAAYFSSQKPGPGR